jgi:hypothetical protein
MLREIVDREMAKMAKVLDPGHLSKPHAGTWDIVMQRDAQERD